MVVDPANSTWGINLDGIFGEGKKGAARGLSIYQVFKDGKPVNGLGSARTYNTSLHFVRETDIKLDMAAKTIIGTMKILMTPDPWVPVDGKPYELNVKIDGQLGENAGMWNLTGTYTATRPDGQPVRDEEKTVTSKLGGGIGPTESGWDNSVWRFQMTQVKSDDDLYKDAIDLTLGIADGKVKWGLIGPTAEPKWPATKRYPIDVSGFAPVTDAGIAKGTVMVTARYLHPGGDPKQQVRLEVNASRVQGLGGS